MAVVAELIRTEENGSISFGNHELPEKAKIEDFRHIGDSYKVKTSKAMTKLEKNGMFAYESVPGTSVLNFTESEEGVSFSVVGMEDVQLIVGLEADTEYEVCVNANSVGKMRTNLGGKLNISVELSEETEVSVKIAK